MTFAVAAFYRPQEDMPWKTEAAVREETIFFIGLIGGMTCAGTAFCRPRKDMPGRTEADVRKEIVRRGICRAGPRPML